MHIEVFQASHAIIKPNRKEQIVWCWHLKNKGRIVADGEPFASKGNAIRAAKAVVRGIVKRMSWPAANDVRFMSETSKTTDKTIITWI